MNGNKNKLKDQFFFHNALDGRNVTNSSIKISKIQFRENHIFIPFVKIPVQKRHVCVVAM